MSVMAMSVRGVTSPSMLKAVRLSRTATLKDVHPRYASFPIRPARLSPTRCQNSTTPSAPAFPIMSSIREPSATSIMGGLGTWTSHERGEDLRRVGAPFFLRLRRHRVPLHLRDLDRFRREEHEEGAVSDAGDDDGAGLELLDGHHHVLSGQLVADVGQVAFQQVQQAVLPRLEPVRDRGGEDPAVDSEEHRDVEVVLLAGAPQLRVEE